MSNISIEANSVDPGQTAPTGAVRSGSTLFVYEASNSLVAFLVAHNTLLEILCTGEY